MFPNTSRQRQNDQPRPAKAGSHHRDTVDRKVAGPGPPKCFVSRPGTPKSYESFQDPASWLPGLEKRFYLFRGRYRLNKLLGEDDVVLTGILTSHSNHPVSLVALLPMLRALWELGFISGDSE